MELEFDKEIDAILRKARGRVGATAATDAHIDADAIAAFAENALPERTRLLYTQHFADCGRCRKLLSTAILARNEASAASEGGASSPTPVIAAPWYSRLFRMPSLAVAMGALVLMLGGTLGYLVLQNRQAESSATVAKSSEPIVVRPQSEVADQALAANANTTANAMPAEGLIAESDRFVETEEARRSTGPSPSADEQERSAVRNEAQKEVSTADTTGAAAAAAPPKPEEKKAEAGVTSRQVVTLDGVDAKTAKDDDKNKLLAGARSAEELARMRRDAPAPASKVGPSRGPVQMQSNQVNTNVGEMAVTRIVGGKTFNNRERAWYDSAYKGQATINIRRGTDEFKKLDSGLRSIANNLGGVVVVVWKDKAYRIQ